MQEMLSQNENISKLSDFLKNTSVNVCLLEGKAGAFKTHCVNEAIKSAWDEENSQNLVFDFKCFESTTLDDIFLMFLDNIKNYSKSKKLTFSKIKTKDISQRINHYLANIKHKSVVIIDSLQNVFNNQNIKDKDEIIRFIEHLSSLSNYKIVLVSNFFPDDFSDVFKSKFIPVEKIEMQMLTKEEVSSCFAGANIMFSGTDIERFYDLSKGSPATLFVTLNILSLLNTSLTMLLSEYFTKKCTFSTYLIQKIFTFVPDSVRNSIERLSLFNGGLNETFLIKEKFFNKEQIDYLVDKGLLVKEYDLIYVKSYIKNYLQKSLSNIEKNEFHLYWKDFYTSQLPLKPVERAVLLSRNTMRAQIEYHAAHIIQQMKKTSAAPNLTLVSYLNSDITSWNYKKTNVDSESDTQEKKQRPEPPVSIKNKNSSATTGLEKYELTKQELQLIGLPVELNDKSQLDRTEEQRQDLSNSDEILENDSVQKVPDIENTYELALSMENVHNYETAATFYLQAFEMKTSELFGEYQTKILEHLAFCCDKMNRTSDAIDFYNKLVDIYSQKNDFENVNKTKLSIAEIYKKTYKLNHARVIYDKFIKNTSGDVSDEVVLLSYIGLADIEASSSNQDKALTYYENAFKTAVETMPASDVISTACFKYASILDENRQYDLAVTYYKKCIEYSQAENSFVSGAYTGLAEIMKLEDNYEQAIEYYEKAIGVDELLLNAEGVYYVALQLAIMYEETDADKMFRWLLKSLSAAKNTKDAVYISNAYIEIGDYFAKLNNLQKALKAYKNAQKHIKVSDNESYLSDTLKTLVYKISKAEKKLCE